MFTHQTSRTRTSLVLPVHSFALLTPRARLLVLEAREAFHFEAGQAVWLGREDARNRKPYSIASAPEDALHDGRLEFLIGLEHDGEPGLHLAGLEVGDRVVVDGPLGGLTLPPARQPDAVLLVAGGTGIAPLRSLLRSQLAARRDDVTDHARLDMIYSARRGSEFAFRQELLGLAHAGRLGLTLTVTGPDSEWTGQHGRVTRPLLASHLPSIGRARCAVCGPQTFVRHVQRLLRELGVDATRIATESW